MQRRRQGGPTLTPTPVRRLLAASSGVNVMVEIFGLCASCAVQVSVRALLEASSFVRLLVLQQRAGATNVVL